MSDTVAPFDEIAGVTEFLAYLEAGQGPLTAAYAVDWTPNQLKARMADDEFAELVSYTQGRLTESIEEVVVDRAKAGNRWAVEMYLFNRAPDRWSPPRQKVDVNRSSNVRVSLVASSVEAVRQLIASDPAALQPGGALDDIVEGEIVD